jgi:hypothetical protein
VESKLTAPARSYTLRNDTTGRVGQDGQQLKLLLIERHRQRILYECEFFSQRRKKSTMVERELSSEATLSSGHREELVLGGYL